MRNGDYEEAERLFMQALSECSSANDKATVRQNLELLHEEEAKPDQKSTPLLDAAELTPGGHGALATLDHGEIAAASTAISAMPGTTHDAKLPITAIGATPKASAPGKFYRMNGTSVLSDPPPADRIHRILRRLEEAIAQAEEKNDLLTLQDLYVKKAAALQLRDNCETLDYAYCLHARAKVLERMHKNEEAEVLDQQATQLRDKLRWLADMRVDAPSPPPSILSPMNFPQASFPPSGSTSSTTRAVDSYPSATASANSGSRYSPSYSVYSTSSYYSPRSSSTPSYSYWRQNNSGWHLR